MKFKPEISFDGVAILLAIIGFSVWIGTVKQTVNLQGVTLVDHEGRIRNNEKDIIILQHDHRIHPAPAMIP
jgi:hypothetical protein